MTRFIMSLEEAVELVLFALSMAHSGDILVKRPPPAPSVCWPRRSKSCFTRRSIPCASSVSAMAKKMYETLLTNEECTHAEDMRFYRVPSDTRDQLR